MSQGGRAGPAGGAMGFACVPTPNSHGHRSTGLFHSGLLEINFSSQSLVTKADEDSRLNGQKHDFVAILEQFILYILAVFLQLRVI